MTLKQRNESGRAPRKISKQCFLIASILSGALLLSAGVVTAQDTRLADARAALAEIPGMNRCIEPGEQPDLGSIPFAATAEKTEFESAINPHINFVNASNSYIECIREVEQAAGDSITEVQKDAISSLDDMIWENMDTTRLFIQPEIQVYNERFSD